MKPFRFILTACALAVLTQALGQAPKPPVTPQPFPRKAQKLNFIGGDQVLLVGDGLIEQAQKQGYLEYRITVQNSGKKLHFHNIGWSGDTPAGIARDGLGTRQAGHEPANEGWLQLRKQITDIKPHVTMPIDGLPWLFVEVETDEGVSGLGECTDYGVNSHLVRGLEAIKQHVVGEDASQIENIWQKIFGSNEGQKKYS